MSIEYKDIINKTDLEFTDISSEEYRIYTYICSNGDLTNVKVNNPIGLNVSKSGGHRIIDSNGVCYYIKPEWIMITWKSKLGQPHFIK